MSLEGFILIPGQAVEDLRTGRTGVYLYWGEFSQKFAVRFDDGTGPELVHPADLTLAVDE